MSNMFTTICDFAGRAALAVLRLTLGLVKALAWWYVATILGFLALFCVVAILEPFGQTVMVLGGVAFLILAPEFVHLLPGRSPEQGSSSSPEPEGPAPSLPAVQVPEHAPGATSIYRGRLTTLPPG
jgi:hypothetical protein